MTILEVENVSKSFTGHNALTDVSLQVEEGTVYGLLGPNGAGKTTLIRIINHITAPDKGRVLFQGKQLVASDVAYIGYLPEERGLYKKMKVGEQALFFARLKGLDKREAEKSLRYWFDRLEIAGWWNKKIEELSKGMAQKVQFIITVLHNPKLLIFDEPFSGFDPINVSLLKREILNLRDKGATVIFSTHNMESVEELCDSITLINKSRNVLSGKVSELKKRFSENRYRLVFETASKSPLEEISEMITNVSEEDVDAMGNKSVTFQLRDSALRRPVLETANRVSDIVAFEPILPSMSDIFVEACKTTENI